MSRSTLYTLGYSGFTPATFAAKLQAHQIVELIDVRRNPVSRKPGFSKAGLSAFLKGQGIEYLHVPALGVPQHLREELAEGGDHGDYLHQFGRYLATCDELLDDVLQLSQHRACCLMCLEKTPAECHRSVVAEELKARANGMLKIEHLLLDQGGTRELEFD